MLAALATNASDLFYGAGLLQALALFLFLANIGPMVLGLPSLNRFAWLAAGVCLTSGVFLGASFAAHPELGVRLRMAHAEVNFFGWTGLLISGAGYYLIPRFAGSPLRWPRLAPVQLAMLCGGIVARATALGARGYGRDMDAAILGAQLLTAGAFLLLAGIAAGTFLHKSGSAIKLAMSTRGRYRPS
jgi:hypothetical protein